MSAMHMMEFVNGLVENYKDSPPIPIGSSKKWSVSQLPDFITNSIFIDCTAITDLARETAFEEYADRNTPPNSDVILPAPHVGLFVDISNIEANTELPDPKSTNKKSLLLCVPMNEDLPDENFVILNCYLKEDILPRAIGGVKTEVMGGIKVKSFVLDKVTQEESSDYQTSVDSSWVRIVAQLLHLVNKPRFVIKKPFGTRQQRRGLNRGGGFAVDAWHKITWNVDKPVSAKDAYDASYHKLPLHFRRGHWRSSEEDQPKSIQRENGGWYTWIEGYWAGHPAFGFKKSYYSPKKGAA